MFPVHLCIYPEYILCPPLHISKICTLSTFAYIQNMYSVHLCIYCIIYIQNMSLCSPLHILYIQNMYSVHADDWVGEQSTILLTLGRSFTAVQKNYWLSKRYHFTAGFLSPLLYYRRHLVHMLTNQNPPFAHYWVTSGFYHLGFSLSQVCFKQAWSRLSSLTTGFRTTGSIMILLIYDAIGVDTKTTASMMLSVWILKLRPLWCYRCGY